MPEKIVTCGKCRGAFDVGHIAAGRQVKCPACGGPIVVPPDTPPPAAARPPARRAPRAGRTSIMRRAMNARAAGAPGARPGRRSMDLDARPGARMGMSADKKIMIGAAVVLAGGLAFYLFAGGKDKSPPPKPPPSREAPQGGKH